jgi:hypothetical protein
MTESVIADLVVVVALIVMAVLIYRVRPPRVTVMPAELASADDEEFIADLTARMQAYGEAVADYYDTPEGHQ